MSKSIRDYKIDIIKAARKAVEELIKVAEAPIIKGDIMSDDDELSADKLKNAAATKKLAILDAFEILNRIELEEESLNEVGEKEEDKGGFAERRSKR
jgi:hypothetical protein